jgi:hypothetical protein
MASVEYRIVDGTDRESFEKAVNELLTDGWALYGSVAVSVTRQHTGGPGLPVGIFYYTQAVTRERQERSVYEDRGIRTV